MSDCRRADVKLLGFGNATKNFSLQKLSFIDVHSLSLYKSCIDIEVRKGSIFILSIKRTNKLFLTRGSVRITGAASVSAIIIQNSWLPHLESFSIEASNLKLLQLTGITIWHSAMPSSIALASSGTLVDMREADAQWSLDDGWITGQITALVMLNCRLALSPQAFARVSFVGPGRNSLVIHKNIFIAHDGKTTSALPSNIFIRNSKRRVSVKGNQVQCDKGLPIEWSNIDAINRSKLSCALYKTTLCVEHHLRTPKLLKCDGNPSNETSLLSAKPFISIGHSSIYIKV